ncbi:MAG: LysM peptidoglycan-binding domain-containing protein, partial [Actinomycetota bacterium]|nr:LysM peptidoglycan-binding domain-containing protein [Actinomycetota bacterium]
MLPAALPALPPVALAVATTTSAPAGWQHHTVRAGDTLYDLALHTGTTTGALAVHNGLADGGRYLRIGQVLV